MLYVPPCQEMAGRPTGLTAEIGSKICDLVRAGASVKIAGPGAGVPWNTCKEWLAKGRDGTEPYASFVEDVEMAKAEWAATMIRVISAAGFKDWRAAAYMLERRIPGYYKPDQRIDGGQTPERVILMYPVPMPLGADAALVARLPGQVIDTKGE